MGSDDDGASSQLHQGTDNKIENPITTTTSNNRATVHIYPYGTNVPDANTKVLHVIRHAEGYHNVNKQYRDAINLDARLTDLGVQQCRSLSKRIQQAMQDETNCPLHHLATQTDLIVTSPLTRCIQTTLLSLEPVLRNKPDIPVVTHESVRETVNYNCDRRRNIQEVVEEFKDLDLDFSHLTNDHDAIWDHYVERLGCENTWTEHRESSEIHVVAHRGRDFFQWLRKRPERHIVLCTHSAFLRCIKNYGLADEIPMQPPQLLVDDQSRINKTPVVRYIGGNDDTFETKLRQNYDNCELRSMVVAFPTL